MPRGTPSSIALLDARVEGQDPKAAEDFMVETRRAGMVEVASDTLIKAHLQLGHLVKGRARIEEMKKEGFQPNNVTFNELLKGKAPDFPDIWGWRRRYRRGRDVEPCHVRYPPEVSQRRVWCAGHYADNGAHPHGG